MLKKTFFFWFFIFSLAIFAKNISISIVNEGGLPIENAYVSVGDTIKRSNVNGIAEFEINTDIITIFVERSPYKSQSLTVNSKNNEFINVVLKDSYDFYINIYEASDYKYEFGQNKLNRTTVKDSIVNIYKNGEMIFSLDYLGRDLGLDLKNGDYTLIIYSIFSAPYIIENVKFDSKKSQYLNIELPLNTYTVSGLITSSQSLLGGTEIIFTDRNRVLRTFSSINGSYSIRLPAGIYTQRIEKLGYFPLEETVTIKEDKKNLSYNLNEIPSILKGRILDSKGNPIVNREISIKNRDNNLIVSTDENGYYEAEVYPNLAFLKIDISGFFPTGRVERIDPLSTRELGDIRLKERIASLSGTVTNGVLPLAGIWLKLYDDNETYYGMVSTDSRGFFSFPEIKSRINYFLVVDDPNYSYYKSEGFSPEDNKNKNFSIILNNNDVNFVLELKTETKNYDYQSLAVFINNIRFQSDKNGIINETIKSQKSLESITIEVPRLNFKNTYNLKDLGSEPYIITIKF